MTEYLPTFIVEPVLRHARRLSRLSSGEESSPNFLPTVPSVPESILSWPSRLWSNSPPTGEQEEHEEHEEQEGTFSQIARSIQLWTNQLEPSLMDDARPEDAAHLPTLDNTSINEIPPLDPIQSPALNDNSISQLPLSDAGPSSALDSTNLTEFPPLDPAPPARLQEISNGSDLSLNPLRDLSDRSRIYTDPVREHAQSNRITRTTRGSDAEAGQRSRNGSGTLPEDDGMGPLRKRINAIWAGDGTPAEKSKLVHILMMERYRVTHGNKSIPLGRFAGTERRGSPMSIISGASQEVVYNLIPEDLLPTFAPLEEVEPGTEIDGPSVENSEQVLGCAHYKRNVKIQCNDCERWYTCRICHDDAEEHVLQRRETKNMLCMICNTPQPVSQTCRMCAQHAAFYYCPVCKLWNNDPQKSVYHCDDCGICRLGEGLGKDFFHCKKCVACMSIQVEGTHRCIEDSTKCDCPICGEYMFTSANSVVFMRCGHSIHESCFRDWCQTSYKCPICSRSIANMESQFRRLDRQIEEQPMPAEYRDTKAYIYCNDCASKSDTSYHWLGLKCELCESYNTIQLQLLGRDDHPPPQEEVENHAHADMVAPPNTISDEAVPIPNSRSASRRQSGIAPYSPVASDASWLMARSPTRPISPIVGSYFGTDSRRESVQRQPTPLSPTVASYFGTDSRRESIQRQATPMQVEDDDNIEFWGGHSPRNNENNADEDESEASTDSDDAMEDDEGEEEEDRMALFGHR